MYSTETKADILPRYLSHRYNAMIHPFGTGPTTFSMVVWDQAESDSYPQTNPGITNQYLPCARIAIAITIIVHGSLVYVA